ncbi:MAG: DUF1624 domain-containing protein [Rubrivivax sp.]|nr:DUF1624 domain-containing protein [Rubrivivax sp.]
MSSLPGERFDRLDALRAVAIVWMAVFHFLFDLNHYGYLQPRHSFHHDALWVSQRTVIVSLFLFCAGLGVAVAQAQGQSWARFWRRWAQVAGCAVLVSIGSAFMFPRSFIFFGVLHGIAVMLIVARLAAPLRLWLWPLGALALLLPWVLQIEAFNIKPLAWTGLITRKPITEDFVPVLPWLGVMLWGVAAGQALLAHRREVLTGPLAAPLQPLAVLGRWSLSFYILHQPVFIGGILAGRWLGWW